MKSFANYILPQKVSHFVVSRFFANLINKEKTILSERKVLSIT